ncbi:MAG: efflux transporter outer membrane subunit [Pseudomonadota bacterium]
MTHSRKFCFIRSSFRLAMTLLTLTALSACVSLPNVDKVVAQDTEVAWFNEVLASLEGEASFGEPVSVGAQWWTILNDDTLNELVFRALEHNADIHKAQAQLREARAISRQVRSALWPTVNAGASYTWTEQSVNSPNGPSSLIQAGFIDRDLEFWGADLSAQWEVDLFGASRYGARSSYARTSAQSESVRAVKLAAVAQVVAAYVQHTALTARARLLSRNVDTQDQTLSLLEKRLGVGLESRLNVDRASGQLAATRARVPLIEARQRDVVYQLSLLTGWSVADVDHALSSAEPLNTQAIVPQRGVKSALLSRRPDVLAAQYQLFSASFDVGAASARLFPQLLIGAQSGYSSGATSTLFDSDSRLAAIAPTLSLPVFNRGRLRAAREAAQARYAYAVSHYEQTAQAALLDAERQWLNVMATRHNARLLDSAAAANRASAERAQKLYDRGLVSYLELLDAQRQQLLAEDAVVQGVAAADEALVRLFVALGGGWPDDPGG